MGGGQCVCLELCECTVLSSARSKQLASISAENHSLTDSVVVKVNLLLRRSVSNNQIKDASVCTTQH